MAYKIFPTFWPLIKYFLYENFVILAWFPSWIIVAIVAICIFGAIMEYKRSGTV